MRRKRFWPTLFLNLLFWTGWTYVFLNFSPENLFLIVLFLCLFFGAMGLTLALLLKNTLQGFILSGLVTIFLTLRLLKMANILNLVLLFSLFLTIELYLRR